MAYNYQRIIKYSLDEPFDVDFVVSECQKEPNKTFLIEVQNTKGISSQELKKLPSNVIFRIAGAYNDERIKIYQNTKFGNEGVEEAYFNSVIYTPHESVRILEEMEKIEKGIQKGWSDIQIAVYVYDRLKSKIMYDPKFERKNSRDIRSLRCLITKETVCAGFSLLFKEMMDRQGIPCEYVQGDGHAWNIIKLGGKYYPVDLTWDNTKYRSGRYSTFSFFADDVKKFNKHHHPHPKEPVVRKKIQLSEIEPEVIQNVVRSIGLHRSRDYSSSIYFATRDDKSRFVVSQIQDITTVTDTGLEKPVFKYLYQDILPDGKLGKPMLLYSESNISALMNRKKFNQPVPEKYERYLVNYLFSKKNIQHSFSMNSNYIGRITINENGRCNRLGSWEDIKKPVGRLSAFSTEDKVFKRSDGSQFLVHQAYHQPVTICGSPVRRYEILELTKDSEGAYCLKRNVVYTEKDLFEDNRQGLADDFLSRTRLDHKVGEAGGYIGYYNEKGQRTYNPELNNYFSTAKRIDLKIFEKNHLADLEKRRQERLHREIKLPTFDELQEFALNYEVRSGPTPSWESVRVRNRKTGEFVSNEQTIVSAKLANIWLLSAGVKWIEGEPRNGFEYAFSDDAKKLYGLICHKLQEDCRENEVINTFDLVRYVGERSTYKHSDKIVINLFSSLDQTKELNRIFLRSLGMPDCGKIPEPLFNRPYTGAMVS